MRRYYTELFVDGKQNRVFDERARGSGWIAHFTHDKKSGIPFRGRLTIDAVKPGTAQRAYAAINAALCVSWYHCLDEEDLIPLEQAPVGSDDPQLYTIWNRRTNVAGIVSATRLAAKCSRHRKHMFALHWLARSIRLEAVHPLSLNPHRWQHEPLSRKESDQVRFALAIVSAYSSIECMGLDVRASNNQPSQIAGAWNPPVRENLAKRLREYDLDADETFSWVLRSTPTRVVRARAVRASVKSEWATKTVRDAKTPLIDAIAHASWLRNRVAAHSQVGKVGYISRYDVQNTQLVARRLLLHFGNVWGNL